MLEITLIRNNAEEVKRRLSIKNFAQLHLIDDAIAIDAKRRGIQQQWMKT